ncbi:efflux RND transporter periplasmic adaptor subunit [Glaciecola petra]|uniref:Efflux RND transporter periplasmic adaptor subunit n=1 Tax=Glaciecola petra TaxID=3075602 RepID=A0ABU2ZQJ7_9ALTE|nr:efflux RND transporter periplasmic adaptor subunit [Aestuariibacter sp. P117]MDT0594536.1 efflux RND transporter periplasmic adaptor subunit [Aestuariibacter sp. P117]
MLIRKNLILTVTLSTAILAGCSDAPVVEETEMVRPAKLLEVTQTSNIQTLNFPAVVEALSSKDLTFQVSGRIEKLNVREGDTVEKGDVIATLEKRNFINELQVIQSQYDSAKLDFERAERLIRENAIAQNVFDQRKAAYDVAASQLDSAKKALEDTELTSPFSGVIASKMANELQVISPSQVIVTLQTQGAAEALIKIPAALVTRSKQLEPIETHIVLDAADGQTIPVTFVSSTLEADPTTQTFEARFGFVPPNNLVILPGMTGNISATFALRSQDSVEGQIKIPLSAINTDSNGQFVWKINKETMAVTRQGVEVGTGIGEQLVVSSGLVAGDTIVAAGGSYLTEGLVVRSMSL